MPSAESEMQQFASSLHRGILGLLLAIVGILGIGMGRRLLVGDYLIGIFGVILAVGAGYWILSLFLDGLRER